VQDNVCQEQKVKHNNKRRASMTTSKAENMRLKFLYKKLIQSGKISLPHHCARKLIGPDCAFHLYPGFTGKKSDKDKHEEEQKKQ
jgi:hypothetical protein